MAACLGRLTRAAFTDLTGSTRAPHVALGSSDQNMSRRRTTGDVDENDET